MSLFKDAEGIWHKILKTEHVTPEVIQTRIDLLKSQITDQEAVVTSLREQLAAAEKDLETIQNG